jgi:2-oxoglutarate dehydrogenase complex dehydrogenase (E1) component-like enzyme
MALNVPDAIDRPVRRVSRPASAAPAVGSASKSDVLQQELIAQALA